MGSVNSEITVAINILIYCVGTKTVMIYQNVRKDILKRVYIIRDMDDASLQVFVNIVTKSRWRISAKLVVKIIPK